jgi:hypothetical protein
MIIVVVGGQWLVVSASRAVAKPLATDRQETGRNPLVFPPVSKNSIRPAS